ncbi:hypothetical protein R6Q59_018117 [Mikania micrantha]
MRLLIVPPVERAHTTSTLKPIAIYGILFILTPIVNGLSPESFFQEEVCDDGEATENKALHTQAMRLYVIVLEQSLRFRLIMKLSSNEIDRY